MRKYNSELLDQLVNERWNEEGIIAKVSHADKHWSGHQLFLAKITIPARTALNYTELADKLVEEVKKQLNEARLESEEVVLIPWDEGGFLKTAFLSDNGFFWGHVVARVALKATYSPLKGLYIGNWDKEVLDPLREE